MLYFKGAFKAVAYSDAGLKSSLQALTVILLEVEVSIRGIKQQWLKCEIHKKLYKIKPETQNTIRTGAGYTLNAKPMLNTLAKINIHLIGVGVMDLMFED